MSTACDERSARSDMTATAPFTLINIGAEQTQLVSGFGSTSQATMNLALSSETTALQFFKRDPPAPHELERAIDAVEDEVLRARPMIITGSALFAGGAALDEVGEAAGATVESECIPLETVEQLFQRLASASLGDPIARRGLPAGNRFAATTLILREFMHHLGFGSITFRGAGRHLPMT